MTKMFKYRPNSSKEIFEMHDSKVDTYFFHPYRQVINFFMRVRTKREISSHLSKQTEAEVNSRLKGRRTIS